MKTIPPNMSQLPSNDLLTSPQYKDTLPQMGNHITLTQNHITLTQTGKGWYYTFVDEWMQ